MDRAELQAWLRLLMTPGLGPSGARRLLASLGSPQAIWRAGPEAWQALVKTREHKALQAGMAADALAAVTEQLALTEAWLAADPSHTVLTLGDARYPSSLLQDEVDPPVMLFAAGDLRLLSAVSVAVVGSRHPTPQGRADARSFARALSEAGLTVVSGLADGVDGAAHLGALEATGPHTGRTVAVVGTGLDVVYPRQHAELAARIAREGLLLSEFPLGTPPRPSHFPRRNRLVAGLTQGTLVVEAALQSGSLITARLAAEMGREVMAMPGSIHAPQARGCHALIKQGAKLVETAQDVLDELKWTGVRIAQVAMATASDDAGESPDTDPVLQAMGHGPVSQEALSARTGMGPAELGARLLELELMGEVARLPGLLFQRLVMA